MPVCSTMKCWDNPHLACHCLIIRIIPILIIIFNLIVPFPSFLGLLLRVVLILIRISPVALAVSFIWNSKSTMKITYTRINTTTANFPKYSKFYKTFNSKQAIHSTLYRYSTRARNTFMSSPFRRFSSRSLSRFLKYLFGFFLSSSSDSESEVISLYLLASRVPRDLLELLPPLVLLLYEQRAWVLTLFKTTLLNYGNRGTYSTISADVDGSQCQYNPTLNGKTRTLNKDDNDETNQKRSTYHIPNPNSYLFFELSTCLSVLTLLATPDSLGVQDIDSSSYGKIKAWKKSW